MTPRTKKNNWSVVKSKSDITFFNIAIVLPLLISSSDVSSAVVTSIFSMFALSMVINRRRVLGNTIFDKNRLLSILYDSTNNKIVFQSPSLESVLGFRPETIDALIQSKIFTHQDRTNICNLLNTTKSNALKIRFKSITGDDILVTFKKIWHNEFAMVTVDFEFNEIEDIKWNNDYLLDDLVAKKRTSIKKPQLQHIVRLTNPIQKSNELGYEAELIDKILKTTPHHHDQLNIQTIDMNIVVRDACNALKKLIDVTNTEICFETLPSVYADAEQLTHVIKNLLKNSIQYRSKFNPQIHIDFRENDDELIFCVMDNGKGISKEYQSSVFTPYYRVYHNGRMIPGIGLGLAVCKYIVNNHKGSMWCENGDSVGSRFYFSLPTPHASPIARMSETQSQTCQGCVN